MKCVSRADQKLSAPRLPLRLFPQRRRRATGGSSLLINVRGGGSVRGVWRGGSGGGHQVKGARQRLDVRIHPDTLSFPPN